MITLPDTEPTTRTEAEELAYLLSSNTATETPALEILRSSSLPNLTLLNLRPQFPCEGPPLPFGSGVRWPNSMRGPIYVLKGGKPHKQMLLDYLPDSFPVIDVYVLKKRMEGDYKAVFKNLSSEVDIPGSDRVSTTLDTAEEKARARLLDATATSLTAVAKSEATEALLRFIFESSWSIIKAIWEYLTTKRITINLSVPASIAGYETPDWIVDPFDRTFSIEAKVPVDRISWHAW